MRLCQAGRGGRCCEAEDRAGKVRAGKAGAGACSGKGSAPAITPTLGTATGQRCQSSDPCAQAMRQGHVAERQQKAAGSSSSGHPRQARDGADAALYQRVRPPQRHVWRPADGAQGVPPTDPVLCHAVGGVLLPAAIVAEQVVAQGCLLACSSGRQAGGQGRLVRPRRRGVAVAVGRPQLGLGLD
jgi:hypothetical protein